ncbi:MAG: hypothetical protein H8E40_04745 [Chloroflexi bacterium]|nr:hypothetical protein [Chloroflexota bacterium]
MERGSGHACRTISRTVIAHLSRSRAGGSKRLPLLLLGLGIVLVVDLQGLLLYNIGQQGMSQGFPQNTLLGIYRKDSV